MSLAPPYRRCQHGAKCMVRCPGCEHEGEPNKTVNEAFRAFARWRAEHDPEHILDFEDAAVSYAEWADKNSIEKYLDAANGC